MIDKAKKEVMQLVPDAIWVQLGTEQEIEDGIPPDEVLAVRSATGVLAKRLPEGMRANRGLFMADDESPMFWIRNGLVKAAPDDCIAIVRPYDLPDVLRLPKSYLEKAYALEDQAALMLERAVDYADYVFPSVTENPPAIAAGPTVPNTATIPQVSTSSALADGAESGLLAAAPSVPGLGVFAGTVPTLTTPALGNREGVSVPGDLTLGTAPTFTLPAVPSLDYTAVSVTGPFVSGAVGDKTLVYTEPDSIADNVTEIGAIGTLPTLVMPTITLPPLTGTPFDPDTTGLTPPTLPTYAITYTIPTPQDMSDYVTELESRLTALGFYKSVSPNGPSGFENALARYTAAFADEDPELAMLALTEIQRSLEAMQMHTGALGQKAEALLGESRLAIEQVSTQFRLEIEGYSVRAQSLIAEYQARASGLLGIQGIEAEAAALNWKMLSEVRGLELQHLGLQVQAKLDEFVANGRQVIDSFAARISRYQVEKGLALEQERYRLEPALAKFQGGIQQEQQKLEQRVAEAQAVIGQLGLRLQERAANNAAKLEAYALEARNGLEKFAQDLGAWSTTAQLALQNQAVKIEAQLLSLQSKGFLADGQLAEVQRVHADYQLQLANFQTALNSFLELYAQKSTDFQLQLARFDKTREGILLVEQLRRELDQVKLAQGGFDAQRVTGDYAMVVQRFQSEMQKWMDETQFALSTWQAKQAFAFQQAGGEMEASVSNTQAKISHYMAYIQGAEGRAMVLLQLAMQYRSQAILLIQNWIHDFGSRIGLVGLTGVAIAPQRLEAIRSGSVG